MTKTTVPHGRSNSNKGVGNSSKGGHSAGRRASVIQPDDHIFGCKILHRQTKRVKFHKAPIVSGKTMNRKETLIHVKSKQNIIKVK
jgi:hypothetical protein